MYGGSVLVLDAMCALVTDRELMRRSTMVMTELPGWLQWISWAHPGIDQGY